MMKSLETKINISASAEKVWEVLTDFDSYPEWNPFVIKLSGNTEVGNQIVVNLKLENNDPQKFKPEVLVKDENREFRWVGKLFIKGLFDGEHFFQLKEVENGVEFIHGENFSGVLVGPIMSLIGDKTEAGFNAMNEALKTRVEQLNK